MDSKASTDVEEFVTFLLFEWLEINKSVTHFVVSIIVISFPITKINLFFSRISSLAVPVLPTDLATVTIQKRRLFALDLWK